MADETIEDAIEQAAIDGIKRVTGDQGSTELMSMEERIAAAKYINSKKVAASGGFGGVKFVQFVPPGMDNE